MCAIVLKQAHITYVYTAHCIPLIHWLHCESSNWHKHTQLVFVKSSSFLCIEIKKNKQISTLDIDPRLLYEVNWKFILSVVWDYLLVTTQSKNRNNYWIIADRFEILSFVFFSKMELALCWPEKYIMNQQSLKEKRIFGSDYKNTSSIWIFLCCWSASQLAIISMEKSIQRPLTFGQII